jgi:hypothetical protein
MRGRLLKNLTLAAFAFIVVSSAAGKIAAQSNWAVFWQKFKTAVVKNDKKMVLSLSKEKLPDADYREMFGTNARRKCFAKAKPVPDEQGGYSVFCGEQGYYFQKVSGQFRFTEGFAND